MDSSMIIAGIFVFCVGLLSAIIGINFGDNEGKGLFIVGCIICVFGCLIMLFCM